MQVNASDSNMVRMSGTYGDEEVGLGWVEEDELDGAFDFLERRL